jgi:hypothetical protein
MGVLMVRCPETGSEVSTGIEIDQESFARLPDKLVSWKCPLCAREHPWLKCDAKFIGNVLGEEFPLDTPSRPANE